MRFAAASLLAAFVLVGACAKQPTTPQPARLKSEVISDDSGEMQVAIDYVPKGSTIDFIVELKGVGTEEMDKIVVEIQATGLVFVGGESQWSGFVAPFTKHRHEVTFKAEDGAEFGTVKVTVSRSMDSHVLMQTEVPFELSPGLIVPDA